MFQLEQGQVGAVMAMRIIVRCAVLAMALATSPAGAQTGKDYNPMPPPMPPSAKQGVPLEQAMKDMEARDRLRPKAVAPRTRSDAAEGLPAPQRSQPEVPR